MRTFYHLTHTSKRNSILEKGLLPRSKKEFGQSGIGYMKKVFLFSDLDDIPFSFVGGNGAVDIWEVKIPERAKVTKDPFAELDGHHTSWMVGRKIPPSDIRRIKTLWHPLEYEGNLNDPLPEEYL